jgi:hypothetical protein
MTAAIANPGAREFPQNADPVLARVTGAHPGFRPAGGRGPARDLHLRGRRRRQSAVASLFQDAGFAAIDLGNLATGGAMQQIHHPLAGLNLIRL